MFDEIPKESLDPKALKVFRIYGVINIALLLLLSPVFFIASHFFGPFPHIIGWLIIALSLAAVYPIAFIFPKVSFERWRYEIKEHEVDIRKGIFVVRRILIPIIRIQHIETSQGPILKRFDLASLSVSTAAGIHSIPALSHDTASALKTRLSNLARISEEDV